jgi:glycosyltransferase involved in cell wall biosynthesis
MALPNAPARICLIRQGYYPLDTRVRREVGALILAGYEVEVICLSLPGEARFERQGQVTVHRVPIGHSRAGHISYLLQYGAFFLFAAVMAARVHLRRRLDLVQVNTMPDSLVFAAIVPRLMGARVLLDLHECMPEFYAVKFGTGLRHPAVRFLAWIEQAAIRFADLAITCTDQMRAAFESRGAPQDKIEVIMNSANEDEFDPGLYSPAERADGEFRIICHGTVERIYGIDTIIRAVGLLRTDIPGLRLDIYGDGYALDEIRSLIRDLDLSERVHVAGRFVPVPELVRAIANADAGVVAIRRDIFRDLTHCNKMFDFITMRKPAIVSRTRSVEAYFDDSCFQMFTAGDELDLARAIRELYADRQLGDRLVRHAARANEPYRWPRQRERYQEIVHGLVRIPSSDTVGSARRTEAEPMAEMSP